MTKQLFWLIIWGILFGYMEAVVVVYLREIYYPEGFSLPFVVIEGRILLTEILREAATLFMMWATVCLAYKRMQSRIAAFIILFGVWDIFYYLFLKLILNWPASMDTWDILFLIPLPWLGPVWAPVLVSMGFIYAGVTILSYNHRNYFIDFGRGFLWLELLSALIIIVSFLIPGFSIMKQAMPSPFPWYLFLAGFLMGLSIFLYHFHHAKRSILK